jgi:hypothetical protein
MNCNITKDILYWPPDQTITDRICKEQFITSTSRGNAQQVIFLNEKDFTDFLRSLRFGGKKISLSIWPRAKKSLQPISSACPFRDKSRITLKEIAEYIGVHYTTVSRAIKKIEGEDKK